MKINPFDAYVIHLFNLYAHRSWAFDTAVSAVSGNELIKGGLLAAVFWWAWFREDENKVGRREYIISGLVMSFVALTVARILAFVLPFRERPLRVPTLHFQIPYGTDPHTLIHWSSFPSDHAALYFSLATTLFFVSRRIGAIAYLHALCVVCLPRIYLGFHYPTDIIAGASLGVGIAVLALNDDVRRVLTRQPMVWWERSPLYFYPCFYLLTFLIATNFDPIRELASIAWHLVRHSGPA